MTDYTRRNLVRLEKIAQAAREFLATIDLAERTGAPISMPPKQWEALYRLREVYQKCIGRSE